MADFDQMYRMQQAMNNPMLNVQQLSIDMPNWLRAPQPTNPLQGTPLLLNQMNRMGEMQMRQDRLDMERERARQLANIQMQTFQAKQAQLQQERQAREAYAAENPEFAAAIRAGERPSDFQRKMQMAGGDPQRYRELFGPGAGAQVSVNMPGQITEEQKIVGKAYGQDYVDLQRGGRQAYAENAKLGQLDTLLDQTYTGIGADKVLAAKKLGNAIGLDLEGVGEAEAAQSIANEFALQLRSPVGGAGMPGAMSDKDREFLQSMTPGLAMSAEGRKALINARRKVNNRSIEVAKMARDYRRKHGSLDEIFFDELAQFSEENQLFADETQPEAETGSYEGLTEEQTDRLKYLEKKHGL